MNIPRFLALAFAFVAAFTASGPAAAASQHLIQQELFAGLGVRDLGNPGNLGSVNGTFFARPIGPAAMNTAAPGWSAQIRNGDTTHTLDLLAAPGAAAQPRGLFGAWYYFANVSTDGVNEVQLISLQNLAGGGNNPVAVATLNAALQVSLSFYNAASQKNVAAIPRNTWVWIGLKWQQSAGGDFRYDAAFLLKRAGQPLAVLGQPIANVGMGAGFQKIVAGAARSGGNASALCRYGAPSLFALDAFADAAYPAGSLREPPTTRQRWYVNPATGSDANTGLTPSSAWRTASKISEESQFIGMLPRSGGIRTGDLLIIDTKKAPLVIEDESLILATDGLTVRPAPGQRKINVQAWKDITAAPWVPTPGHPGVFQTSDTDTSIVVWESDRWMAHPTGSSFSAVAAELDATPGSFWTDGTTLYVHPFTGGLPSASGEVFTRSRFRGNGDSAILVSGNSWSITGLRVSKTCLASSTSNDPYVAYCLQQAGGSQGGTGILKNCDFRYASKHLVGFTADSTDSTLIIDHVTAEQATPYVGLGGQTAFVSYMGEGSGNMHRYLYCSTIANSGLIGSATGQANPLYPAFVTHGPAGAYAVLQISHCNWASGSFDEQGTVAEGGLRISHSRLGEALLRSPGARVTASSIRDGCTIASGGFLANCRLTSSVNYIARFPDELAGEITIQDCTIDLRQNPTGPGGRFAFWRRTGPLQLIFQRNTFLVPAGSDLTLINSLDSSEDELRFNANRYQLGSGHWFMNGFDGQNLTFEQWRQLGYDRGSTLLPAR